MDAWRKKQAPPFGAPGPGTQIGAQDEVRRRFDSSRERGALWEHQRGTERHLLFKNGGGASGAANRARGPLGGYFGRRPHVTSLVFWDLEKWG